MSPLWNIRLTSLRTQSLDVFTPPPSPLVTYLSLCYSCHEGILCVLYNIQYLTLLTFPFIITHALDTPSSLWRNSHTSSHTLPFRRTRPSLPTLSDHIYFPLLPTYSSPASSFLPRTYLAPRRPDAVREAHQEKETQVRQAHDQAGAPHSLHLQREDPLQQRGRWTPRHALAGEVDRPKTRVRVKWCRVCTVVGFLVVLLGWSHFCTCVMFIGLSTFVFRCG